MVRFSPFPTSTSGATIVTIGENFDYHNVATNAIANTETLRATGVTVNASRTGYITDIWGSIAHLAGATGCTVYLKIGTDIWPIVASNSSGNFQGIISVHMASPIPVSASTVIRIADKALTANLTVSGGVGWRGYETT